MYDAGHRQIVNIDYSPTVIKTMAKRNIHREEMTCEPHSYSPGLRPPVNPTGLEMDVRDLDFENGSFDVAIDKGMEQCC